MINPLEEQDWSHFRRRAIYVETDRTDFFINSAEIETEDEVNTLFRLKPKINNAKYSPFLAHPVNSMATVCK